MSASREGVLHTTGADGARRWETVKEEGKTDTGDNRKEPGPQPRSLARPRACSELEFRAGSRATEGSDFSSTSVYLLPTYHPAACTSAMLLLVLQNAGRVLEVMSIQT